MKKLLLGLGTVAAVVAPVVSVVACGSKEGTNVNGTFGKELAAKHVALWTTVEWKDDNDHKQGVKLITGKTGTDVKKAINDFFGSYDKISRKINWEAVKAKVNDAAEFKKIEDNVKAAVDSLSSSKVDAATDADLLTLAYRTNVLYQNYIPLIAITYGENSVDAQNFIIAVLEGHSSGGNSVTDATTYKGYVSKLALDVLKDKNTILENIN